MENKDNVMIMDHIMRVIEMNNADNAIINENFGKITRVLNQHSKLFKWIGIECILFAILCYLQTKDINALNKRIAILESKSRMEEHKKKVEDILQ